MLCFFRFINSIMFLPIYPNIAIETSPFPTENTFIYSHGDEWCMWIPLIQRLIGDTGANDIYYRL